MKVYLFNKACLKLEINYALAYLHERWQRVRETQRKLAKLWTPASFSPSSTRALTLIGLRFGKQPTIDGLLIVDETVQNLPHLASFYSNCFCVHASTSAHAHGHRRVRKY